MKKNIVILGSTGSVGKITLEVIKNNLDHFNVVGLSINSNIEELEKQTQMFNPKYVSIFNEKRADEFSKAHAHIKIFKGFNGLSEIASIEEADIVVLAMSGSIGIMPAVKAIKAKKKVLLANKEVLVAAGEYIMSLAKENNVDILPLDSEHSAIFQCLNGENIKEISRLILTASGGPFFNKESKTKILNKKITISDALNHPTYNMGSLITINSSTLMNKGFEVIEAHYLFDVPIEKIDVVIHPQSLVHSFVEFIDSSMLAQISEPNMYLPISYALFYPNRKKTTLEKVLWSLEDLEYKITVPKDVTAKAKMALDKMIKVLPTI